jgi:DNA-binding NarL/FixJ family response regulator
MPRILIADDHREARRAQRQLLEQHAGWEVCGEAENGEEAVEKTAALHPDLVVLDLSMPKMSGVEAARAIHKTMPQLPILLFSMYASNSVMTGEFRNVGFSGAVDKSSASQQLGEAIETLLKGGTYFDGSAASASSSSDHSLGPSGSPLGPTARSPVLAETPLTGAEPLEAQMGSPLAADNLPQTSGGAVDAAMGSTAMAGDMTDGSGTDPDAESGAAGLMSAEPEPAS